MAPSGPAKTILVDLRGCQVNQDRGIPAYAQNLVARLCEENPEHRYLWWIEKGKPLPTRKDQLSRRGEWRTEQQLGADSALQVDALLSTWLFMPAGKDGAPRLIPPWLEARAPLRLGIVYDLIPLLFQDRYLASPETRAAFLPPFRQMRSYDRLFAISEATRRDVIRHGGIDPFKVVTLPGGIDAEKARALDQPCSARIPQGLAGDYFIYVGGEDWRKNLGGLIRGFAQFTAGRRPSQASPKLAIVCKMSGPGKAALLALAVSLGLPEGAVVCTGFVSDESFVALTRSARAMIFPSFYEGLGLPILEAYACGIPVLGSDNSSIRDLVHPQCRFDPEKPEAIAEALGRFCDTPSLAAASMAFGQSVLGQLSWDRSAELVAETVSPPPRLAPAFQPPPRIAVAGVLPPRGTGIAAYTLRNMQSRHWGTDFFTDAGPRAGSGGDGGELLPDNRVLPQEILPLALRRGLYGHAIFVLGNSPHHEGALKAMLSTRMDASAKRWAYLHEADIWALLSGFLGAQSKSLLPEEPAAGPPGAPPWIRRALKEFPGLRPSLQFLRGKGNLDGLLVNSLACRDLILAALGEEAEGWDIRTLFLPVAPPAFAAKSLSSDALRIGFFGVPAVNKLPELVVAAFDLLVKERDASLVLAGWGVQRFAEEQGILSRGDITCLESPSDEALAQAMAGVDVAVQLRVPTLGESSGVVGQLLALGKPVIVTGEGSYAELDDAWVLKVPAGVHARDLAARMAQAGGGMATLNPASLLAARGEEAFEARLMDALQLPGSA
jgi:glycosyltransferase involved in cell wall biosynthesis